MNRFIVVTAATFIVLSILIGITGKLFNFNFPLWGWALVVGASFAAGFVSRSSDESPSVKTFAADADDVQESKKMEDENTGQKETKLRFIFRIISEKIVPGTMVLFFVWLLWTFVSAQPIVKQLIGECPGGIVKKVENGVIYFEGHLSPCGDRFVHLPYRFRGGEVLRIEAWGKIEGTSNWSLTNSSGVPLAAVRASCITQNSDEVVNGPFTPIGGEKIFSAREIVECFGGEGLPPSWNAPYGAMVYRDGEYGGWHTPSWVEEEQKQKKHIGYITVNSKGTISLSFNMFLWKLPNNRDCWLPTKCSNGLVQELYHGGYGFRITMMGRGR